jgi:hypothetical protein
LFTESRHLFTESRQFFSERVGRWQGGVKKSDFEAALELELLKVETFLTSKAFQVQIWRVSGF